MNPGHFIRPSKELRNNYNQISSLSRSNPVAITVNGKEDTVVLSTRISLNSRNTFVSSKLALRFMHISHKALDDVKLGRTQAMDEAFDDILGELDKVRP